MVSVTQQAHEIVRTIVRPGDVVLDATAGNGHDTLFLSILVGAAGRVLAIDIQRRAIEETQRRIAGHALKNVALIHADHAAVKSVVPAEFHGQLSGAMFNLGYLPGGDQRIKTGANSTLAALDATRELLRPGGVLTVVAYPDHPGGSEETRAVMDWIARNCNEEFEAIQVPSQGIGGAGPQLFAVCRRTTGPNAPRI